MLNDLSIRDVNVVESFAWGNNCSVWTLLDDKELTVMQEKMPPNSGDELHYHNLSTQFVYILSGTLQIEIDDKIVTLNAFQGLKIPKKSQHRVMNNSNDEVTFLLMSTPGHVDDRVLVNT